MEHHGQHPIQHARVHNCPSSRTNKSGLTHRTKHVPQLMLCLGTIKPWMRNTRTPLSHSTPSVYALLSATNFFVPTNPGSTVTTPKPTPALEVITSLTQEHTENLRTWRTYTDTDKSCKQKILGLVPEVYYCTLKKNYTAYAGITCLTLLTHLHSKYGILTSQDINDIDKRTKTPISGEI